MELNIIFESNRSKQIPICSEYKLHIPGDWWIENRSLEFSNQEKNQFKLLNIKPTPKKFLEVILLRFIISFISDK